MQKSTFYRFGIIIYKLRWLILAGWMLIILGCIPFLPNIISPFTTTGFIDEHSASAHAEQNLDKELGYNHSNQFLIIYNSPNLLATSPAFQHKIKESLQSLNKLPVPHEVIMPNHNKKMMSKDKHTAYAIITLKDTKPVNDQLLAQFNASIQKPKDMTIELGGGP
ncbi:MAG: MMPL family transporter, partial [bacterium]|nr:MMPL family transporter [bacterium]